MPSKRQPIPALMNGVSQQPASLRHSSQAEEQINCLSSLAKGVEKRPPVEHVAVLAATLPVGYTPAHHFINRDASERYVVTFRRYGVDVYDITNDSAVAVAITSSTMYTMRAVTSATNGRPFRIALDGTDVTATSTIAGSATVVWESADNEEFTSPTLLRTDTASTSAALSWTDATDNGKWVRARTSVWGSGAVNANLAGLNLGYLTTDDATMSDSIRAVTVADYTFVTNTEIVTLMDANTPGGSLTSSVQLFSDLPAAPATNSIHSVEGSSENDFDTYYVKFDGAVYRECLAPGIPDKLELATMPHVLIRIADGTFTFGPGPWEDREVGDGGSNPVPKFVGQAIRHVVFYRNRLGFLASEYVTCSRVGNVPGGYFNFWRSTVQAVVDSDPFDIGMAHSRVADLQHGIVFNKTLLLFSRQTQFVMTSAGVLTPSTATVDPTTEFVSSAKAEPVAIGNNVYFPVDGGGSAQVREYFVDSSALVNDAADITAHVPTYIPATIHNLAGSSNQDILVGLTDGDPASVYAYRFFWDGDSKAQSAWSKWSLTDAVTIHSVEFIDSDLWLVVSYADATYLLRMKFNDDAGKTDIGVPVLLDRRVPLTGSYSVSTGLTTWVLPYDTAADPVFVLGSSFGTSAGFSPTLTRVNATTFTTLGNYSAGPSWCGVGYNQLYRFSEQFPRTTGRSGVASVATIGGRLQLRRMTVRFSNTGAFDATVLAGGRDLQTYPYRASLGTPGLTLGALSLNSGTFAFDIYARSGDVQIDLVNNTWLPSTFLSAEWDGTYSPHAVLPLSN